MSYCNFFNKEGGNLGEAHETPFKTITTDPDFDSSSVRTKIENGFHTLVSTETGDPIVGIDRETGNFQSQSQRNSYNQKVREQLNNDPTTRRQNKNQSFQEREDRLSFNDPTGEAKKRLLQISEENDRVSRSNVDFTRPEPIFKPKPPPPKTQLPDVEDLINEGKVSDTQKVLRAEPANINTIPAEYKSEVFKSNPEVISDSGKQLGDTVRGEQLSQTILKPTTGTQLDTDSISKKTPKFKQNKGDAKAGLLTEEDLDESSLGETVGKVAGKVLGLAGVAVGVGETLGGKGTVKAKAKGIAEIGGSQVAQEAQDEAISRLELTKRYRALRGNQKDFAKNESDKIQDSEGREMNQDEASDILDRAEQEPIQYGNQVEDTDPNTTIVPETDKTEPTMNSRPQADEELGDGTEPKFTGGDDAFSSGGANAESSGLSSVNANVPNTAEDIAKKAGEDAAKKAAEEAGEEAGEIDAIGGGVEDPIGDVIAGAVGLGTLLGGIFGDKEKAPAPIQIKAPVVSQSIQFGVDE